MDKGNITVGMRIRNLREEKGISQKDLAKAVGIKPPSLSDIESGKTKRPSGEVLLAIAKHLQEEPDYFITGIRTKPEAPAPGLINIAVTNREELILELIRTLTPEQQEELLTPLRAAYAANQVTQKNLATKIKTIGNRRIEKEFGRPGEKVKGQ